MCAHSARVQCECALVIECSMIVLKGDRAHTGIELRGGQRVAGGRCVMCCKCVGLGWVVGGRGA